MRTLLRALLLTAAPVFVDGVSVLKDGGPSGAGRFVERPGAGRFVKWPGADRCPA